ncbi:MAG: hypothetical protein IBX66_12945 [Lutibacter sp.]|nr:hypothetical protein [Lutibacter sp.]
MKNRKVKIIVFSILSVFISGFLLLILVGMTLLPITRRYTVLNETNEVIYITPLMQFGIASFALEDEWDDKKKMKDYIEQIDDFSILSQNLTYSPPAFPAFNVRDIKVNPNTKTFLYIDYEQIKQEGGPQILLIKDNQNNYYYKEANFWENDIITDKSLLNKASKNIIDAKENERSSLISWLMIFCIVAPIALFPYLLIKNIKLQRRERKSSLQKSFAAINGDVVN